MQRSVQVTDRLDFKETTADTQAYFAVTQAEVGNVLEGERAGRVQFGDLAGPQQTGAGGIALAMAGDVSRAQAIVDDLGRRFPEIRFCIR